MRQDKKFLLFFFYVHGVEDGEGGGAGLYNVTYQHRQPCRPFLLDLSLEAVRKKIQQEVYELLF